MSVLAFFLIFISIFLHVTWNMLSKENKPSVAFYVLMSLTAAVIWLPFFLMSDIQFSAMPAKFYYFLGGSILGEVIYMIGLAQAYRRSNISLVYPVVRALPVLMVAAVTLLFGLGKPFGVCTSAGMLLIACGCFLMPVRSFSSFSLRSYFSSVIGYIVLGAAGTTMYTIFDSCALDMIRAAVKQITITDTLAYLFIIELSQAAGEFIFVLFSKRERKFFRHMAFRSVYPVIAGCCSSSAYALVLLAMGYVSNVSYIQAFRQMSLPLGFLAGVVFLHEKVYRTKVTGMILVVLGLVIVSLFK